MAKYDDVSWHYEGEYPQGLPIENSATHIGMFLAWCINNDLVSQELVDDNEESIKNVKNKTLTGAEFLINNCDEKFTNDVLNNIGNEFAGDYYNEDTKFAKKFDSYLNDYSTLFNKKIGRKTIYHIENTWDNYNLVKTIIDKRFNEWKDFK